jgi:transcriptional regulator with XRE-family HTH domain
MNSKEAKRFGMILRKRREALGLTVRQVSNASNVPHTTVARIERGEFSAPRPDKLARVAAALELSPVELFAQAGYFSPDALPDFATYLSAKYPDLSALAVAKLQQQLEELTGRDQIPTTPPTPTKEEFTDDPAGGAA